MCNLTSEQSRFLYDLFFGSSQLVQPDTLFGGRDSVQSQISNPDRNSTSRHRELPEEGGMWGRYYWGRKVDDKAVGIVVVFAWMSSKDRHLKPYVNLYASIGWSSLVCHPDFLALFFPEKATSLAHGVLRELAKEIKTRPLPIVFSSFSGGPKSCMYKVLQIIDGKCEEKSTADYHQVKDCICGQIYDSSPVDFTSDLGTRFVLHPSVLKMSNPPKVMSWMANGVASILDSLFFERFEAQRAEYWETLYSSVGIGPFLIFCSEDDELAPYRVVLNFAKRLEELGGDVKLLKWDHSPHVGHYKIYPDDYMMAVTEFLAKSTTTYFHRMKNTEVSTLGCNPVAKSDNNLRRAAMSSNESLPMIAVGLTDDFYLPSSVEYHETKDTGSFQDEQNGASLQFENPPDINVHGVLGKSLFSDFVPKNVEGWETQSSESLKLKPTWVTEKRRGRFNPIKCPRRSRL